MSSSYTVEFTKSAKKEFDRLPSRVKNSVLECLAILVQNPFTKILAIKKLKIVKNLYRVRLGDYRVVYELRRNSLLVVVIKVGHRREVYRFL